MSPTQVEEALAIAERNYDRLRRETIGGPVWETRQAEAARRVDELTARLDEIRSSANVARCRFADEGCDGWAYDLYSTGPLCASCLSQFTNPTSERSHQ